jgi:hypothetical protein
LVCDLLAPWAVARGYSNFTNNLLVRWLTPGGTLCRDARTTNISTVVLDVVEAPGEATELGTAEIHEFTFWALDDAGRRRCLAEDYFEVDLSWDSWKSRAPVVDHDDSSYSFRLLVAPRFAVGRFRVTVVLIFRSFEGLKFSSARFKHPVVCSGQTTRHCPALETYLLTSVLERMHTDRG